MYTCTHVHYGGLRCWAFHVRTAGPEGLSVSVGLFFGVRGLRSAVGQEKTLQYFRKPTLWELFGIADDILVYSSFLKG